MTRFGRTSKLVAVALGGALALSACGSDSGSDSDDKKESAGGGGTIVYANDQEPTTWNNTTADGNVSINSLAAYWVATGFQYFGEDGALTPNEEFGTYELVSEDPLIVDYSIHPDAIWSDGTPIDCDDVLLHWAQQGGYLGFSQISTTGMEDIKMPDCEPGDKDFSYEYRKPFADWEGMGSSNGNTKMMPAHIVAEQGGLEDGDELVEIIRSVDWEDEDVRDEQVEAANERLEEAIEFFKDGWIIDGALPDKELIPSSGPFTFGSYSPGEQLTLVPNEKYWGTPPKADEVIIRFIAQDEQAQALQNGEIDIMSPQPSTDLKEQLEALPGVQTGVFDQYAYEHMTFDFENGVFKDSLELRQAWMKCTPRQLMVDNLIKPIQDDAEVRNSKVAHILDPYHDEVVAASLPDEFAEQDIEGAREILEDLDAVGTEVSLMTLDNPRRNAQGALIKDACEEAGFEVDFTARGDFFDQDGPYYMNQFDVGMAAWVGSSLVSGWNSTYRTVDECTAAGKGNNTGCYANEDMDQLLDDLMRVVDEDEKVDLIGQISALVWDDAVAMPLFNHPGMAAWADDVQNVVPNPAQSDIVWNMPEWHR